MLKLCYKKMKDLFNNNRRFKLQKSKDKIALNCFKQDKTIIELMIFLKLIRNFSSINSNNNQILFIIEIKLLENKVTRKLLLKIILVLIRILKK